MKKIIFLFLIVTASLGEVMCQNIGGGLFLGLNLSTMSLPDNDSTRLRPDITAGLRMALIPKKSIFGLELDVVYSRQGTNMKSFTNDAKQKISHSKSTSYLQMPLLLNIYLKPWNDAEDESKLMRFRVGPQIGLCLGGRDIENVKTKKNTKHAFRHWESSEFNRWDYGIVAAFSVWYLEIRYYHGLNNVFLGDEASRHRVISIVWSDIW